MLCTPKHRGWSTYAPAALLEKIPKWSRSQEIPQIEMMLGSTMCEVKIFMITIQAPDSSRELNVDVTKVEKWELQKTDNPNYQSIKAK